jgi:hypothetical protein
MLRMTADVFNEILETITPRLHNMDTFMRDCISTHEMLVSTLRFLASDEVLTIVDIPIIKAGLTHRLTSM